MKNTDPVKNSRRKFLKQAAGLAGLAAVSSIVGCEVQGRKKKIPASFRGANHTRGHLLRTGNFPAVTESKSAKIVIVGSGIAGFSAAWYLAKNGIQDFILLELEDHTGGNSSSGKGESGEFPWGAHYVPVPGIEQPLLLELLKEWGIVTAIESDGAPVFDDAALCFAPQERLFFKGKWQEGLIPKNGINKDSHDEIERFLSEMEALKFSKGADGKFLFALPLDNSSTEEKWRKLDSISMKEWMDSNRYTSAELHWYVNYSCRDDFGAEHKDVSAWAGLHYFCSRRGGGKNAPSHAVLTWPSGNGKLAELFFRSIGKHTSQRIFPAHLVWKAESDEAGVVVKALDCLTDKSIEFKCEKAILALPLFVRKKLLMDVPVNSIFSYAPWVVVNLHIRNYATEFGYWDNVAYDSESLGYIVSTHQDLRGNIPVSTTLTWYFPLSETDPVQERKNAMEKEASFWVEKALDDIERMHEGFREFVTDAEAWVWGHGMIRPVPGMIWGNERIKAKTAVGNIHFAHSDLSGMSLFEEAFYQGIRAACEAGNLPLPTELKI